MANIIKTNLASNNDIIIDIALANPLHLNEFLSKIDIQGLEIKKYLCICSDTKEWRKRIEKRIKDPTPNQIFKSADEAINHYKGYDSGPTKGEIILDSTQELVEIIDKLRFDFNSNV